MTETVTIGIFTFQITLGPDNYSTSSRAKMDSNSSLLLHIVNDWMIW